MEKTITLNEQQVSLIKDLMQDVLDAEGYSKTTAEVVKQIISKLEQE